MKKFLICAFILLSCILLTCSQSYCADASGEQSWENMINFDRSWKVKHEAVTDKDFENVMKRFEKKKKPKKYEFEENESRDSLNDMSILNDIANFSPIILFPMDLRSYEGEVIPAGYYKLNYVEKDKEHYLLVSQSRKVFARLKMQQTSENFESDNIQFAELRTNDEESMNLIYGNLDINLVKKLYILH